MSAESALDLTATVMTPENIEFEYRVAGPFRRFPAFVFDLIIRGVTMFGLFFVFFCSGISMFLPFTQTVGAILLAIGYFFFDWLYGLFFETLWNGRTPGKSVSGLRVISIDGRPISAYQATIRNFLRAADLAPFASLQMFTADAPPFYWIPTAGVAVLCMLMTKRMQRLGDLAAGTMVVIDERKWVPPKLKLNDPAIDRLLGEISPSFRMSRTMLRTVALYVERRGRLPVSRRREMSALLANALMEKAGVPPTTDPDLLLSALYKREYDAQWKSNDKPDAFSGATSIGKDERSQVSV